MLMPPEASPEVIAQMKAAFGFDKPLYIQYVLWLFRAVQGDFGLSVFNATPVWGQLDHRPRQHPHPCHPGRHAGLYPRHRLRHDCRRCIHGRWPDKLFSAIATTGVSLPHYWCAIVLVLAFRCCTMAAGAGHGRRLAAALAAAGISRAAGGHAVVDPDGRDRPAGARHRARDPRPGFRRRAGRQGPDALAACCAMSARTPPRRCWR